MWRRLFRADSVAIAAVPLACLGLLGEAYSRTDLRDAEKSSDCACIMDHTMEKDGRRLPLPRAPLRRDRPAVWVMEGAVPAAVIAQVRAELSMATARSGNDADVRQDTVRWVRADDTHALHDCIRFLRRIPHWASADDDLVVPQQCQLAVYRGDGSASYQRHLDQCRGSVYDLGLLEYWRLRDYRRRRLTAILYLNDPDRPVEEGGALRCWVPKDQGEEGDRFHPPMDIVPKGGTLVIFDSTRYVFSK
jgi:diadenosine tetraphosphatase ApaH/serine/threonine PP2A family protein phosphatase